MAVLNYGGACSLLSFALIFGMMFTNYEKSPIMKSALYAGFVGCTAATLTPMIHAYGLSLIQL